MCGIAVAVNWAEASAMVGAMIAGLRHRGEVSDPVYAPHARLAAATRRLPIVDPQGAVQPLVSADGRIHVVLNGEIYNHAELCMELEALGARFRTGSDVEVVATALQAWGAGAFQRFEGMYALFAVDAVTGDWLAARDPLGVKPLYVVEDLAQAAWLFCSEMRPLLSASEALPVLALPPGHILSRDGCFRFRPRWRTRTPEAVELGVALRDAVHRRLPPNQACAVLFSGGLDSTLVLHHALEARPRTPAYVLGDANAPDLRFAEAFAGETGADLRLVPLTDPASGMAAEIERAVKAVETFEPETVRSGHCSLRLAHAVHADGLRVALCGDGADELFAGYVPLEEAYAAGEAEGAIVREQCVDTLAVTALQRIDRCGMRHQVEIREPYLDSDVVAAAMATGRADLVREEGGVWVGKQPLRRLYAAAGLPPGIGQRAKTPLNEGAGLDASQLDSPWAAYADERLSANDLNDGIAEFADFGVTSKEELLYIRLLAAGMDIRRVPHLRQRPFIRMPASAMSTRLESFRGGSAAG